MQSAGLERDPGEVSVGGGHEAAQHTGEAAGGVEAPGRLGRLHLHLNGRRDGRVRPQLVARWKRTGSWCQR